jgi:hypothetical protein
MNCWQLNYNRFKELYHKGEQIVVGFRGGFTHGYITKIDESGFGLFQLDKPKEYWYDWEHFEFISHPGFKFKKLPNINEEWIDKVNIFTIGLLEKCNFPQPILENGGIHYKFNNSNDIVACISHFNTITTKDFQKFEAESPWGTLWLKVYTSEAQLMAERQFVQTLPKNGKFDIVSLYHFNQTDIKFTNISGTSQKYVRDDDELSILRIAQIKPEPREYVSWGDPWITQVN